MSKNDITGDDLVSKSATAAYRDGWDRIFGRKKEEPTDTDHGLVLPRLNKVGLTKVRHVDFICKSPDGKCHEVLSDCYDKCGYQG